MVTHRAIDACRFCVLVNPRQKAHEQQRATKWPTCRELGHTACWRGAVNWLKRRREACDAYTREEANEVKHRRGMSPKAIGEGCRYFERWTAS